LGLALWCHILALYYVVTVALVMLASGWRAWPSYICYALGLSIGYFPGILWNANHGWDSLAYVLGHKAVGEIVTRPSLWSRLVMLVSKQLPILVGYEATEPSWLDWARWGFVCLVLASIAVGLWQAGTRASRGSIVDRILLTFVAVNIGVCVFALPYLPGMPRYLLFLTAPFAVLLARSFHERMSRLWIAAIIAVNALSSWALLPAARERDHGRRELAHALESLGVRYCYSDFSLAPIINFLSEEKVVCTTKLGPTTTEHFFEHRRAVEAAATAAFVPVNSTAAAKLERRLERLGVSFERTDFMKPVIYRLSRKVDPQELFPQRDFPWR
jgi:hypothetical protein